MSRMQLGFGLAGKRVSRMIRPRVGKVDLVVPGWVCLGGLGRSIIGRFIGAGWLFMWLFTWGCVAYRPAVPLSADYYYINPAVDFSRLGRVTVVEPTNDTSYPEISADMSRCLFEALQKRQLFGCTLVRRSERAWSSLQVEADGSYGLEELAAMRKKLGSSAVMVGRITKYQPYPHMSMGLRLRLISLTDGRLLWAVEQVWDSSDIWARRRIGQYFRTRVEDGFAPLGEELVAVSPLEFFKFVAYETAQTLRADNGK